jgi:hypothetical protein
MIMVLSKENVTEGTMSDEKMTIDERYKYLRKMQKRYKRASKEDKGQLLGEMEEVTNLHRKSLIRLMNKSIVRKERERERGASYGEETVRVVRKVSESMDHICAERIQPNLVWMAEHLEEHSEVNLTHEIKVQLTQISVSTIRRRLGPMGIERRTRRRRPEEANRLRRSIPESRIAWNEKEPGHFEVDLVHHNGGDSGGQYVHTLQMVDVATGWSERAAVLGRSYAVMEDGFRRIHSRSPLPFREVHPDNGSEFFNDHVLRYWTEEAQVDQITRSRPWQKNDNRFVEQKNDSLVRAILGYHRLDTVEQTAVLNALYDLMWIYYNFFQPVMRLKDKTRIPSPDKQVRYRRRFDQAQTPFDRLCQTQTLDPELAAHLHALRKQINPLHLRQRINQLLSHLFELPDAPPDQPQDVYETIGLWKCGQQADPHSHNPDDDFLSALPYSYRKELVVQ